MMATAIDEPQEERIRLWRVGIAKTLFIVCMAIGIGVGLGVSIGYPPAYNGITEYFYEDYETGQYGYRPR